MKERTNKCPYYNEDCPKCNPKTSNTNNQSWEERAVNELGNVVHVWMVIGKEMNPLLKSFIQEELNRQKDKVRDFISKRMTDLYVARGEENRVTIQNLSEVLDLLD